MRDRRSSFSGGVVAPGSLRVDGLRRGQRKHRRAPATATLPRTRRASNPRPVLEAAAVRPARAVQAAQGATEVRQAAREAMAA